MSRTPAPFTPADFDDALAAATRGELVSDTGAPEPVQAALDRVAREGTPAAVQAARAAFADTL